MHVCAPWTDLEIHNLKDLYLSNQPIKIIARMLDRSASAVNKGPFALWHTYATQLC